MACASSASAIDLRSLKLFLERECVWRTVVNAQYYKQLCAVATKSAFFEAGVGDRNLCYTVVNVIILKRDGENVLCISVNGKPYAQLAGRVRRVKKRIVDMDPFYLLRLIQVRPADLDFSPMFATPSSAAGAGAMSPMFLYEHCSLVGPEEASGFVTRGGDEHGDVRLRRLGVGSWVLVQGDTYTIYCFVLSCDLYVACCDRRFFPSAARMVAKTTACDSETCSFCRDHGKHVDVTGKFIGCVPERGCCLCYTSCGIRITPGQSETILPFLCDDDESVEAVQATVRQDTRLSTKLSDYVCLKNVNGENVPVKDEAWNLMKIDPDLSLLIILSCPVLKRLTLSHSTL
uniref:GP94 n=1 Tax=Caviid herpesvirus 2 str. CIDMTR TaxID=1415526 RepID=U6H6T0_9BETA|nr:GP94 [Caviid herpesvirus 2 str. CIDMTR]